MITTHKFVPSPDDDEDLCAWPGEPVTGQYTPGKTCGFVLAEHQLGAIEHMPIIPRKVDTTNDFLVGSQGLKTVIIGGTYTQVPMESAKAYRLAAWLVVVAEMNAVAGEPTFEETLEAIRST